MEGEGLSRLGRKGRGGVGGGDGPLYIASDGEDGGCGVDGVLDGDGGVLVEDGFFDGADEFFVGGVVLIVVVVVVFSLGIRERRFE